MRTCTKRLEWDAAHRVMNHESKCAHLHGHRYVAEVTVAAKQLDDLGRVIDFSVVKTLVGDWIEDYWDHGAILNEKDRTLIDLCSIEKWKYWASQGNPTAENMAMWLYGIARKLLDPLGVEVVKVVIFETPNCWAEYNE